MPARTERPRDPNAGLDPKPAPADDLEFTRHMEAFDDESGGVARPYIMRSLQFDPDDPVSMMFFDGLREMYGRAKRGHPMRCGCCGYTFTLRRPPSGLVLLVPNTDAPRGILVFGLCPTCVTKPNTDIIVTVGGRMWSDVRVVDAASVSREGGRA